MKPPAGNEWMGLGGIVACLERLSTNFADGRRGGRPSFGRNRWGAIMTPIAIAASENDRPVSRPSPDAAGKQGAWPPVDPRDLPEPPGRIHLCRVALRVCTNRRLRAALRL